MGLNNKVDSAALDSNLYREVKVQMEVAAYTDVAVSAFVSMAVQDMSAVELVENTVDTSEELKAAAETYNYIQLPAMLLAQIGRLRAAVVERKASCMVGHIVERHWEEAIAVVDSLSHSLDSKELADADMKQEHYSLLWKYTDYLEELRSRSKLGKVQNTARQRMKKTDGKEIEAADGTGPMSRILRQAVRV